MSSNHLLSCINLFVGFVNMSSNSNDSENCNSEDETDYEHDFYSLVVLDGNTCINEPIGNNAGECKFFIRQFKLKCK